jgi:hypothetical protein
VWALDERLRVDCCEKEDVTQATVERTRRSGLDIRAEEGAAPPLKRNAIVFGARQTEAQLALGTQDREIAFVVNNQSASANRPRLFAIVSTASSIFTAQPCTMVWGTLPILRQEP